MKNSKILITGAHGFLGSHLVSNLKRHGYKHLICPKHSDIDLLQRSQIRTLFKKTRPDIVIHLAAKVGGIGANQQNPGLFFYENMLMGLHLIDEARIQSVSKFVVMGTVCSYPKYTPVPFKESALWNGYPEETNAPYGLAKKMLLVQAQGYRSQYGLNTIYLIPVNLYGPGDHFDPKVSHVIPALIRKFDEAQKAKRKEIVVWGDGTASREFIYVADCAEAIRLAMERYNKSLPVNIGTGVSFTIKRLAQIIKQLMLFEGKLLWDRSKPKGQPQRRLDISKAKKEFGFTARVGFEEGLKKTIRWYKTSAS